MIKLLELIEEAKNSYKKLDRTTFLYLDPKGDEHKFAQCGTCKLFTGKKCLILGNTKITAEMSCNLYVNGTPLKKLVGKEIKSLTPKEAGLVNRQVRCENCISYNKEESTCELFKSLNKSNPNLFDLDIKVDEYGCCNAQRPK